MFYDDHNPPHVHARYGRDKAVIAIDSGIILEGYLRSRGHGLVKEWLALHRDELERDWQFAREKRPLVSIEPLP